MDRFTIDEGRTESCLIIDDNKIRNVANAQEAAFFFADDPSRDGGGHFQRSGDAESPIDIVTDHLELGSGAAAQRWNAAGIHRSSARYNQAALFEDDFQAALNVFAGVATGRGAGIADDCDILRPLGGENQADHFDRKMKAIGNDLTGQRGMREQCAHAHHFSSEPAIWPRFA